MATYQNYVMTGDSLVIVCTDENPNQLITKHLIKGNPYFNQISDLLKKHQYQQALEMMDSASRITKHSKGEFYVQDGMIFHKGELIPQELSNRIIQFADAGLPVKPLINFWENLSNNPSADAKKDLFSFLNHNHIPLTEDGCFIAYKRVRDDFTDLNSGKFDNNVGQKPHMDRNDVDPDRNNTCSRGLHVAAFNYANTFYANGHLLAVKVNPKDVVAVPIDYNGEKMRVSGYEVMEKIDGPRKTIIYPEFSVGELVAALPNLDNVEYFVAKVLEVIEKEGETPQYRIQKINSTEEYTFPQHHIMHFGNDEDEDEDGEQDYETCVGCGEYTDDCTCGDEDEDEE